MNNQSNDKINTTNNTSNVNVSGLSELDLSALCDESVLELLDEPFEPNTSTLRNDYKYKGFDSSLGNNWIYPTNLPVRQYQFNITRVALFKNTLVVLPTGLGKTFIAAVVMYNIFRWYPHGKIIFMAPTRPLVSQQIDACYHIMGIPRNETAELTGKQNKKTRCVAWKAKRVFFATPQVVWSDLNDPAMDFPINDIKLIVVDEAHKAKGKYAYTEVIQSIATRNKMFRILALSATPGRAIKDVIEVVQNLLISHVEVRWENSIDVLPYIFKKNIKTIVVPLGEYLSSIRNKLINVIDPYVRNLIEYQVITGHSGNLSKNWLLMERNRFRDNSTQNRHPQHSSIMSDFGVCISLYHALELLERHGIRVFLNYFDDNSSSTDEKYYIKMDPDISNLLKEIRENVGPNPFADGDSTLQNNSTINGDYENFDFGHPKFEILRKCLTDHLEEHPDSKAIIFCEYRESVFLIKRLLLENRPLIRSKVFVGQGASHARTITQKEQIAIMNDFRKGVCNTLIATCVAEEGIDVGEVDLIICFDVNNRNPTRYVQRIGRTGRRRQGKVIMLVTEGKEQNILRDIMATKDGTNQKISKSNDVSNALYREAPRLVPPEFNPQCTEMFIKIEDNNNTIADEDDDRPNAKKTKKKAAKATKRPAKKRVQPSRTTKMADVRQFFQPVELNREDQEVFDVPQPNTSKGEIQSTETNECDQKIIEQVAHACDKIKNAHFAEKINSITLNEKMSKLLERYRSVKAQSNVKALKVEEIIDNNQVPVILKRMCLNVNRDFVETHCQEEKTSKYKRVIEELLGGQKNVLEFLYAKNPEWSSLAPDRQNVIHKLVNNTVSDDLTSTINETDDNSETSKSFIDDVQNLSNLESQQNVFIDPEFNMPIIVRNESKYESQQVSQCDISRKFLNAPSSTPKKVTSTPKLKQLKPVVDSPIKNSPIAKAFERSIKKMNKTANASNNPDYYLQYLGLTSIDDLFSDSEEEMNESEKAVTQVEKATTTSNSPLKLAISKPVTDTKSNENDNQKNDLLNNETEIFEAIDFDEIDVILGTQIQAETRQSPVSTQETQYTVSQILKICATDDENTSESGKNDLNVSKLSSFADSSLNVSRSGKKRKNLHIGSISDLFQDDDDDDDHYGKSNLLVGNIEVHNDPEIVSSVFKDVTTKLDDQKSRSGSDCTEEYDISEVLKTFSHNPNKTDKKVDGADISQLSDKENYMNNAQPVKKQRSADMFDTFDEPELVTVNRTKSTPCNLQNPNNNLFGKTNLQKPSTYLESFIENARTSPKISFSPENNHSTNDESKVKSPSLLNRSYTRPTQNVSSSMSLLQRFENSLSAVHTASTSSSGSSKSPIRLTNGPNLKKDTGSPSVFGKKPNLSRLQLINKQENPFRTGDDNSSPFLTCKELENPVSYRVAEHKATDERQSIRNKLTIFEHKRLANGDIACESTNDARLNPDSDTPDEDEIFATCKLASPYKKPNKPKRKNVKRRGRCSFIDDEAAVSGDESSDEDMDDFLTQIDASAYHDEGDPNIDMHAKYLQSVMSPLKRPRFRIPPPGYRREAISNIFSQFDPPDDSTVLEDSFVVKSDEAIEEEDSELSELERAELMLRERKKLKRRMKDQPDSNENRSTKRRRRIIHVSSDSNSD